MQPPNLNSLTLALVSVAGPTSEWLELRAPGPLTIGRRTTHSLPLPQDEHVSRDHAMLQFQPEEEAGPRKPGTTTMLSGGRWMIRDTGSRHGTWVNGVRLEPDRDCPLRPGDLIVISPWTFQVVDKASLQSASTLRLAALEEEEEQAGLIRRIGATVSQRSPAQVRLDALLECAAAIHAAQNEQALAEAVLDAALAGTGFVNGAVLRPSGSIENVEVVAHRGMIQRNEAATGQTMAFGQGPRLSRSLIAEAAMGEAAILVASGDAPADAYSVVQLGIDEAICIPLMLGPAVSGFLYLDNRRAAGERGPSESDAAEFAVGLGKLAAMALANLKRAELERRQGALDAEMAAAAEAQRFILPSREVEVSPFRVLGESRTGKGVGGDFFDVIALGDGRAAVALGDVTGKGIAASVLMTATQGFLNAALQRHGDPARAVEELNRFVHPRTPSGRFVTLWVGVFDSHANTLTYVDAGHGYAALRDGAGQFQRLSEGTGPPVGVDLDSRHTAVVVPMSADGLAVVVSDGFVEQPAPAKPGAGRRQFGMDGVGACLAASLADPAKPDPLQRLFAAVERHAGGPQLSDDATAVLVRWA